MSVNVCRFNYFLKHVLTVQGMMYLNCIIVSRYIFIFWLKNPAAFQDEFWSPFLNIWIILFAIVSQIIFEVILGKETINHHICTGLSPPILNLRKLEYNRFNAYFMPISFLLHIMLMVKIKIFKNKAKKVTDIHPRSKLADLLLMDQQSLTDLTTNILTVICAALATYSPLAVRYDDVNDFNEYPFYLLEYYYKMIRPPLFVNLVLIIYFIRHRELWHSFIKELKNLLNSDVSLC
jgi:hypothetical protein